MIKRERQKIAVVCDKCGQVLQDTQWRPHKAAWEAAKAKGWTAVAVGKDWQHHCPECKAV